MKIIGIILVILGILGIILTVLLPDLFGYAGLIAGAAAILTGVVFLASCTCRTSCYQRRGNDCCS